MVVKNMSWMVGERLVQMCVGFIISLISARYLGPTNYGVINYTLAFVTFFTSLSSLGLDGIIINRIVSESENQGKILGTALVPLLDFNHTDFILFTSKRDCLCDCRSFTRNSIDICLI